MKNETMRPDLDVIDSYIREITESMNRGDVGFAKTGILAQLYQARALNEIAQSLDEIVRDGIGVKRDD